MKRRTAAVQVLLFTMMATLLSGRSVADPLCPCPGTSVPLGSASGCDLVCYGGAVGTAGSCPSPIRQLQQNLTQQAGPALRQALSGTAGDFRKSGQGLPAEAAAAQAELQRILKELEHRRDETRKRLAGQAGEGAPPAANGTLADLPAESAAAQLTLAAYYVEQAAGTKKEEDKAVLVDAAFSRLLGVPMDLPAPAGTPALVLEDADLSRIEAARGGYRDAWDKLQAVGAEYLDAEQLHELALQAGMRMRERLHAAQRAGMQEPAVDEARSLVEDAKKLADAHLRLLLQQRAEMDKAGAEHATASARLIDLLQTVMQRKTPQAPKREPDQDAHLRGFIDASQCLTTGGGAYCSGIGGGVTRACAQNYRQGFRTGERVKERRLREAYRAGSEARQKDLEASFGFLHPGASGPCRTAWLTMFTSGYFGYPFTLVGR